MVRNVPKGNPHSYVHRNMNYPLQPSVVTISYRGHTIIMKEKLSIDFGKLGRHVLIELLLDKTENAPADITVN